MFKRFPSLATALIPLFRAKINQLTEDTRTNEEFAMSLIDKRISRKASKRRDFMTRILEQRDPKEVSDIQLAAHASDFVLAGSETTATALSAITYYLLKTPLVMQQLQGEIRQAFKSYDAIDAQATLRLRYLRAVILEGLRIYPPLPLGLPRVVPEGGDVVDGHMLPGGVRAHCCGSGCQADWILAGHRIDKPCCCKPGAQQFREARCIHTGSLARPE
jgi:cytochrome P450